MFYLSFWNEKLKIKNVYWKNIFIFTFPENTLWKKSIVIMKKFAFEILTHLYVFRPHVGILLVIYVCVSEHDSVKTMYSIELKFGMCVTD